MAVYINTLIGGNITIGSGGSVLDATKTRFTLQNGTVEEYRIEGTITEQWMADNEFMDYDSGEPRKWVTSVDIGTLVTTIGANSFRSCEALESITIPDSVTNIGSLAFDGIPLMNVTIISNGGNAENVKQMIITAIGDTSVSDNITWNMPS